MNPLYLRVKNWDKFQHYKSRDNAPSWIKMYPDLLGDYQFQKLTEPDRYRLMAIWLLAGKLRNRIPFDTKFVAKSIDVRKVDLLPFVSSGWLELVDEDGCPVSIESLDALYTASSNGLALGEQSRKAGEKGREEDGDSRGSVYTLPASADLEQEVENLLKLSGCDTNSRVVVNVYAKQLPLATVADIRQRAQQGRKGIRWAVKALQGAVDERNAA
jgi:hypothetical protein